MSSTVDIRDLPSRFREAVAQAASGDEVIVADGSVPRAKLVPIAPAEARRPRVPGLRAGAIEMSPDFDAPLPDESWTLAEVGPMAYGEFNLEAVERSLGVTVQEADLFPDRTPAAVPPWLPAWLARGTRLALISEKARSEFIVVPVLLAAREISGDRLAIYSGQRLDVDPDRGLVGECDFILAVGPAVPPLRAPIATVVEAKKNDVEAGLGQCIAQMVAARAFNAAAGRSAAPVYGCVTTGETWQFLRLDGAAALLDRRRIYLDDVGGILGALAAIVADVDRVG